MGLALLGSAICVLQLPTLGAGRHARRSGSETDDTNCQYTRKRIHAIPQINYDIYVSMWRERDVGTLVNISFQ